MTPAQYVANLSTQVIVQKKGSQGGASTGAIAGNSVIIVTTPISVTAITPNTGDPAGNEYVEITGTSLTGASNASIGGVALSSFASLGASTVSGNTGAHAASATPVDVSVTAGGNTGTKASAFTYAYQSYVWSQTT